MIVRASIHLEKKFRGVAKGLEYNQLSMKQVWKQQEPTFCCSCLGESDGTFTSEVFSAREGRRASRSAWTTNKMSSKDFERVAQTSCSGWVGGSASTFPVKEIGARRCNGGAQRAWNNKKCQKKNCSSLDWRPPDELEGCQHRRCGLRQRLAEIAVGYLGMCVHPLGWNCPLLVAFVPTKANQRHYNASRRGSSEQKI